MRRFLCTACGHGVFFENTRCEQCGSTLGYRPDAKVMTAFGPPEQDGSWQAVGVDGAGRWRPCQNYAQDNVCNWMVPAQDPSLLCASCRHTEVIPLLDRPANRQHWAVLEAAKRRLFYTLDTLGLARPGVAEDPVHGLRFHFLEEVDPANRVLTGHDAGLITLNIAEADDVQREARRTAMDEPYRTLLGHFRHEVGHFYWDRLIAGGWWLLQFRSLFGDESVEYGAALDAYYRDGPAADWQSRYISAYAASHPWEDWAETFAHYLHVMDALETADDWQLPFRQLAPGTAEDDGPTAQPRSFRQRLLEDWLPLSQFLNSMNRSLGQKDSYPFLLPHPVADKLAFVDEVVRSAQGVPWTALPPVPREAAA